MKDEIFKQVFKLDLITIITYLVYVIWVIIIGP